ncbi:helix-turn-helix transcriptional regulator [Frondihabitans sp. VKM Ac-2883]|uniref:AraC family transcriptional regulator n=1 Tax=Frondihabitans sp. VKM Ac-2883 TaxID=2783823 RepID=UPI00188AF85E|nr:helix-turn-helix transcriptional regulator [Frondihabitans sp. VKM Ac-2883]MBF4575317.1 AraC family transcriptional regulator [Frondihabitans sp. VKM Ac-2883]
MSQNDAASRSDDAMQRAAYGGHEPDEAIDLYSGGYNGSGFYAEPTEGPFSFRYTVVGDDEMTLRTSSFSASMRGTIEPEDEYVVSWITTGRAVMDIGGDEVKMSTGRPAMFPTGKRYAFHFSDVRQNLIHFDAGYLERLAAERTGGEQQKLHFDHTAQLDPGALKRWHDVVSSVAQTMLGSEPDPLLRAEAKRLAASALLDTFPHQGPRVAAIALPPGNARLATALEYIHHHAAKAITTSSIAQAAGLSLRGLQHAFNHQLGTTPTDYLRGVRLDLVRAELLAASPSDATVGAIAHRWGFAHSGRFSSAYVQRFAEYPAVTLRR